jgi:hypothetical protein
LLCSLPFSLLLPLLAAVRVMTTQQQLLLPLLTVVAKTVATPVKQKVEVLSMP